METPEIAAQSPCTVVTRHSQIKWWRTYWRGWMVSVRSVHSLPVLFVAQVITVCSQSATGRGPFYPSETDQAHIVKETQRDAAALTSPVHRSPPSTSASASIQAPVAGVWIEVQAWSDGQNQTSGGWKFRFQFQMRTIWVTQTFITLDKLKRQGLASMAHVCSPLTRVCNANPS